MFLIVVLIMSMIRRKARSRHSTVASSSSRRTWSAPRSDSRSPLRSSRKRPMPLMSRSGELWPSTRHEKRFLIRMSDLVCARCWSIGTSPMRSAWTRSSRSSRRRGWWRRTPIASTTRWVLGHRRLMASLSRLIVVEIVLTKCDLFLWSGRP